MKKDFLKALTTDCDEIYENSISNLAKEFAKIFEIEGCIEKMSIFLDKKKLSTREVKVAIIENSIFQKVMADIVDKVSKDIGK